MPNFCSYWWVTLVSDSRKSASIGSSVLHCVIGAASRAWGYLCPGIVRGDASRYHIYHWWVDFGNVFGFFGTQIY
jgi:hypothetical protein